ncbi:MAG TPA: hypothetical protein VFC63_09715 [Blastocatellia bacterium]|nr:hypothetical protein [Blastocatellia bacterium]
MKIIPIFGKEPEQIEERIRLFRAIGCEIYQDGNGQIYAVMEARPEWLNIPDLLIYETGRIPLQWVAIKGNWISMR